MCECIAKIDESLKEHNALIVTNLFGTPRVFIELCKFDEKKRGRIPKLEASFCPFCGEEYPKSRGMDD